MRGSIASWHLADLAVRYPPLLPAHAGLRSRGCRFAGVFAVRLRDARRPRPPLRAEAIGIDVKRAAFDRLRGRGRGVRRGRRAVRLRQGSISPGRWRSMTAPYGAARRHPDHQRADRGRIRVHCSGGHHHGRQAEYWRALLGGVHLLLVLVLPPAVSSVRSPNGRRHGVRRRSSMLAIRSLAKAFGGLRPRRRRRELRCREGASSRAHRAERGASSDLLDMIDGRDLSLTAAGIMFERHEHRRPAAARRRTTAVGARSRSRPRSAP